MAVVICNKDMLERYNRLAATAQLAPKSCNSFLFSWMNLKKVCMLSLMASFDLSFVTRLLVQEQHASGHDLSPPLLKISKSSLKPTPSGSSLIFCNISKPAVTDAAHSEMPVPGRRTRWLESASKTCFKFSRSKNFWSVVFCVDSFQKAELSFCTLARKTFLANW